MGHKCKVKQFFLIEMESEEEEDVGEEEQGQEEEEQGEAVGGDPHISFYSVTTADNILYKRKEDGCLFRSRIQSKK